MTALLLSLCAALAGSMLFFAAIVAPTVFRSLPAAQAGPFLRALAGERHLESRLQGPVTGPRASARGPGGTSHGERGRPPRRAER